MDGREGITRLVHMELRQRAPRAADGIERLATRLAEPDLGPKPLLDQRDRLGFLAMGLVHERKASERQRNLMCERRPL